MAIVAGMQLSRRRFLQLTAAGIAATSPAMALAKGDKGEKGEKGKKKKKKKEKQRDADDATTDADASKQVKTPHLTHGKIDPAKDPYGIKNTKAKLPDWDGSHSSESVPGSMRMFRGNLTHTYYGSGTVPDKPQLIWKFRMSDLITTLRGKPRTWQGTGWSGQTLIYGDYAFVGSTGGHFHCFEKLTGNLVWTHRAERMIKGSPCLYKNRIYFPSVDNYLRCVDATDGTLIWKWRSPNDIDSSPRVYNDLVYIGGEDGAVKCFDPDTGDLKWKVDFGVGCCEHPGSGGIESSLAIDSDGVAYFGHLDGYERALKLSDQTLVWKNFYAKGADIDASALIVDDKVYVGAENAKPTFKCLSRKDGSEIWTHHIPTGVWSTAALWKDTIIVGGNDKKLYCFDKDKGDIKWTFEAGGGIWSSPSVVDGKVFFGDYDKYYRMVDAETGKELWKYEVGDRCHSGAAIEDGHIWVGAESGWYYCFG